MYPPQLDAVSGRSYRQSSQAAGALGGRRDIVQWFHEGDIEGARRDAIMRVVVAGAAWRILGITARVRVAPASYAAVRVQGYYFKPGETVVPYPQSPGGGGYPIDPNNVMYPPDTVPQANAPTIAGEQYTTDEGMLKPGLILPIGTLVGAGWHTLFGGAGAEDLTIELHYLTCAVGQ